MTMHPAPERFEAASRPRRKPARVFILLLLLLPCLACSSLGGKKQNMEDFTASVEGFNTALRWRDYKMASVFVAPNLQEQFWRQVDILDEKIRLTEYEIRNISMTTDGSSYPVILKYRYYVTSDPHLQTQTIRQQWLYSKEAEGWQIVQSGLAALIGE